MQAPPRNTVGIALRRALYTFRQVLEVRLRPLNLSLPLAGILVALGQEDGLSGAELARRETVTAQTMNQLVMRLVERGLVDRRRHHTHGRVLTVHLTRAGEAALVDALAVAAEEEERMLSGFSPRERQQLLGYLERCVDMLGPPSHKFRRFA